MTVEPAERRPARRCYKCGRQIGPDETICDDCNRAGMATPSASQYHGTIVVAIVAGIVLMAVAASLAMRGVGPYRGRAVGFQTGPQGTVVATVSVTNQGTSSGRAKCRIEALDSAGNELGVVVSITPQVAGGATVTYDQSIPGVGDRATSVGVSCQ